MSRGRAALPTPAGRLGLTGAAGGRLAAEGLLPPALWNHLSWCKDLEQKEILSQAGRCWRFFCAPNLKETAAPPRAGFVNKAVVFQNIFKKK